MRACGRVEAAAGVNPGALRRAATVLAGAWAGVMLCLGAIAAPSAFALLAMLDAARAGQGAVSFAVLHGVSAAFFVVKGLLVAGLAWRFSRG